MTFEFTTSLSPHRASKSLNSSLMEKVPLASLLFYDAINIGKNEKSIFDNVNLCDRENVITINGN